MGQVWCQKPLISLQTSSKCKSLTTPFNLPDKIRRHTKNLYDYSKTLILLLKKFLCRKRVAKLKTAFAKQNDRSEVSEELRSDNKNGAEDQISPESQIQRWALQGRVLLQRSWKQIKRDKATTVARIMSNVSSAIIFGSIYWRTGLQQSSIQNRMGLLQVRFGQIKYTYTCSSMTFRISLFALLLIPQIVFLNIALISNPLSPVVCYSSQRNIFS